MSDSRVALVTGSNRGIGFEVVSQLVDRGLQVILTSRKEEDGAAAAARLRRSDRDVRHTTLDVIRPESVAHLREWVMREYGRLDVLVNNAAVYLDEGMSILDLPEEVMALTLETNLMGSFRLCQAFIPQMKIQHYGRVVNVSSGYGAMQSMSGRTAAYRISKVGLNAMTKILAAELQGYNIKVNAACPGWVHTEMGGMYAPRTPEDGADTLTWLATVPDDGPTGGFFRDRKPVAW